MGANCASSILLAPLVNASVLQPDADELRSLFFGQVFKEPLVAGAAVRRGAGRLATPVVESATAPGVCLYKRA